MLFSIELSWCCFSRRNKSSRNALRINGEYFWKIKEILERKDTGGESRGHHEGGGRPPRARPLASWTPCGPPWRETDANPSYKSRKPQNRTKIRSSAAASLCSHQKPIGTLFRHPAGGANHHRWPSSSSRWSPWQGGSSSPSGLRVCTSSYVFDLSLSRVLDLAWSWCIASFAIIVGSYDVSPPLSLMMNWVFPFKVILSDWVFYENTWCMSCRVYLWWQWDITCLLMYVLVTNLRVSPMNLCIGVGTRFRLDSPVETLGHSFEVLCVGWIDESEIVWCISYNHTHGHLRWHWSI